MANSILGSRTGYSRYYGDFRGVDFSSDHTQVHDQRLAYAVNMYRDYQSGQGQALETVPGFRRRFATGDPSDTIYGIHRFVHRNASGSNETKVLVHAGTKLILWRSYPRSMNIIKTVDITLPGPDSTVNGTNTFTVVLPESVYDIKDVKSSFGVSIDGDLYSFDRDTHQLEISSGCLHEGSVIIMSVTEGEISAFDILYGNMNEAKSTSFVFNNRLYFIDGKNYLVYDGSTVQDVPEVSYVPTTYINIVPGGENAGAGVEHEQRNMLSDRFIHTFVMGSSSNSLTVPEKIYMNEKDLDSVISVKLNGTELPSDKYRSYLEEGYIVLKTDLKFGYGIGDKLEVTASKRLSSISGLTGQAGGIADLITKCTLATVFDSRVFLSGNPSYPNYVFYAQRNSTGYVDPTYFGVLNHVQDGVSPTPITGMVPVADTLAVLKAESQQDGAVYFHTAKETGEDLQPVIYPSVQGLNGIGCLGACTNFLDDPVFVSKLGVEGIGQLSVRYERAVEHRSSLVDAVLVNKDLSKAMVDVWNGYLIVLVDGQIFMADSRQRYTHEIGTMQYEWYFLDGIGVYEGQYSEYLYASAMPEELQHAAVGYCTVCGKSREDCTCSNEDGMIEIPLSIADAVYDADLYEYKNLCGTAANPPDDTGAETGPVLLGTVSFEIDGVSYTSSIIYTVREVMDPETGTTVYRSFLCEKKGNYTGGTFKRATAIHVMEDNIFFGTENGVVCSFNFDQREENGEISAGCYHFDERIIKCGCATKMDNCGIPGLTKSTVKKSTVIKTKTMQTSSAKIKVRTNKKPYEQISRINGTSFSFENLDFADLSFTPDGQNLFAVKEKEKKWVEKQYYLYSDEFLKPFSLYYITFKYVVIGRYKE